MSQTLKFFRLPWDSVSGLCRRQKRMPIGRSGRRLSSMTAGRRGNLPRCLHSSRSARPHPGLSQDAKHGAQEAFAGLLASGVASKALELGWEARELVGVQRHQPHDHPSLAGLIFSMRPGDTVPDVRRAGCIIAYGTVRHIWRRTWLPADGSICLPWELTK